MMNCLKLHCYDLAFHVLTLNPMYQYYDLTQVLHQKKRTASAAFATGFEGFMQLLKFYF